MKTKILYLITFIIFGNYAIAQHTILNVWPKGAPGAKADPKYKEQTIYIDNNRIRISHVTEPQLAVYLPSKDKATGAAVVICPGGGYTRLAIDHEGYDVANWFNSMGVAAFVLKYRLPSDSIMEDKSVGPLQDVQEAIRIVRRNATKWNINPDKIGVMGFSAGGHLAGTASTMYNEKVYQPFDSISARPDFSILIYGVLSLQKDISHGGSRKNLLGENPDQAVINKFSNELNVTKQTPPAFIVHSADDKTVPFQNSIRYFEALKKEGIPAELHIYEQGGHGYGLAPDRKSSESTWPKACEVWLRGMGLVE